MQYRLLNLNEENIDGFCSREYRRISMREVPDDPVEFVKKFNKKLENLDWKAKVAHAVGHVVPGVGEKMFIAELYDYDPDKKEYPYRGLYGMTKMSEYDAIEGFRKPTPEEVDLCDFYFGKGKLWEQKIAASKQNKQKNKEKKHE